MNINEKIAELGLPQGSYIIVASGILGALGIRPSNDIDMVVTNTVFEKIKSWGWNEGYWGEDIVYQHDVFDIGNDWYGKTAEDLLENAQVINNIPYLSLDEEYREAHSSKTLSV